MEPEEDSLGAAIENEAPEKKKRRDIEILESSNLLEESEKKLSDATPAALSENKEKFSFDPPSCNASLLPSFLQVKEPEKDTTVTSSQSQGPEPLFSFPSQTSTAPSMPSFLSHETLASGGPESSHHHAHPEFTFSASEKPSLPILSQPQKKPVAEPSDRPSFPHPVTKNKSLLSGEPSPSLPSTIAPSVPPSQPSLPPSLPPSSASAKSLLKPNQVGGLFMHQEQSSFVSYEAWERDECIPAYFSITFTVELITHS